MGFGKISLQHELESDQLVYRHFPRLRLGTDAGVGNHRPSHPRRREQDAAAVFRFPDLYHRSLSVDFRQEGQAQAEFP